ncbi:hypothetical protein [Nocardioides terrisoli]|uniref:hypothetical protein n=1 Tax=Nocardioides terrisoli TaxID=3388267 RepID=UPI00287B628B|nr:hypothetical protein [Nocardioides marmorisolisilvae]
MAAAHKRREMEGVRVMRAQVRRLGSGLIRLIRLIGAMGADAPDAPEHCRNGDIHRFFIP